MVRQVRQGQVPKWHAVQKRASGRSPRTGLLDNFTLSGRNYALRDETASRPVYASLSSSVRYLGASAFTFSMYTACSYSESFGGGVVRVATRTPTSKKNFSCPAGEQIQSMRTASPEAL